MPFYNGMRRAVLDRDYDAVKKILETGYDVNNRVAGETPLNLAVYMEKIPIIDLLLRHGADPNLSSVCRDSEDGEEEYPIMVAARKRNSIFTTCLLNKGADVNKKDVAKFTALYYAVICNNQHVAQLLLESGSDVHLPVGRHGTSVLHAAVEHGHLNIVQLLCENGCQVNQQSTLNDLPLHCVKDKGLDTLNYLLENGSLLNVRNTNGHTPLHEALMNRQIEVAKCLIQHGGDVNLINGNGQSCLKLAMEKLDPHKVPHIELIHTIIYAGISIQQGIEIADFQVPIYIQQNEELCDWLKHYLRNPTPLRDICRVVVRRVLQDLSDGKSIVGNIELLPVPQLMKVFLKLKVEHL